MWKLTAVILAMSVVLLTATQALAQDPTGEGCDGEGQKGVTVDCAGFNFCTCADPCDKDDDCKSGCCSGELCVPGCVCDGKGDYRLCDLGENPTQDKASDEGGCAVGAQGQHATGLSLVVALGLLGALRAARARNQKEASRDRS